MAKAGEIKASLAVKPSDRVRLLETREKQGLKAHYPQHTILKQ